jgi:hypothetical protein
VFLAGLGPDCAKLVSSNLDSQILQAARSAAGRWFRLFDAELQVQRETAALKARSRTRPAQFSDASLGQDALQRMQVSWERAGEEAQKSLRLLSEQTRRERLELESYTAKKAR